MKKSNIIVAGIVAIICIISGIFIFMPNNNVAFESYYQEIKKVDEYKNESSYLKIEATRSGEYVDFKFYNPSEELLNVKVVIIPEKASLRFSKTFLSVGVLETYSINIVPNEKTSSDGSIYTDGLAASMKNKEDEYLVYLEFNLANETKVKEYLKIEVEE